MVLYLIYPYLGDSGYQSESDHLVNTTNKMPNSIVQRTQNSVPVLMAKAVRATILLGDKELDCYQRPCGKYQLSQSGTTSAAEKPAKRMVELARFEKGQSLLVLGFEKGLKYSVEAPKPRTEKLLQYQPILQVLNLSIGNSRALDLVLACGIETLERRIDSAFGKVRTEQERNERFVFRRDGIVSRHFWTDCIDEYIKPQQVSEDYKRWNYIQVSDLVDRSVLRMTAREYRELLQLPAGVSTRDYLNTEQLKQIDTIEKAAGTRVKRDQLRPKQALKMLLV